MKKFFFILIVIASISVFKNLNSLFAQTEVASTRRVSLLQVPNLRLNFSFPAFRTFWITNADEWKKLWKDFYRGTNKEAPTLTTDFNHEVILAIFWPSVDDVVRIPALVSSNPGTNADHHQVLRLNINLNTPCAGIITDQSPAMFLVVNDQIESADLVEIKTDTTHTVACQSGVGL